MLVLNHHFTAISEQLIEFKSKIALLPIGVDNSNELFFMSSELEKSKNFLISSGRHIYPLFYLNKNSCTTDFLVEAEQLITFIKKSKSEIACMLKEIKVLLKIKPSKKVPLIKSNFSETVSTICLNILKKDLLKKEDSK